MKIVNKNKLSEEVKRKKKMISLKDSISLHMNTNQINKILSSFPKMFQSLISQLS